MKIIVSRVEPPVIVVHGGAGSWKRVFNDPDYPYTLQDISRLISESIDRGYRVLEQGDSLTAVVESVKVLEDSGMLNAGMGSALNIAGEAEMDAAIMDSRGNIGAVGAVKYPRNPIELALLVALETDHVVIVGRGADMLAEKYGLEQRGVPPDHIFKRYNRLLSDLAQGKETELRWKKILKLAKLYGYLVDTVGAVALDRYNNLAVATSTGGIWLKHPGRLGDTPIIGAGFYADNMVAVTATGYGEIITRSLASRTLAEYLERGLDLEEACRRTIAKAEEVGGKRVIGLIAVTRDAEVCLAYDTDGMPSGYRAKNKQYLIEL